MITRLTEYINRTARSKKDQRFFRVRFTKSVTFENLEGVVVAGSVGEVAVVTERTAGFLVPNVDVMGQCTQAGEIIPIDKAREIELPAEPSPATKSPFGEAPWDQWHDLAEQRRILRERVVQLRAHLNRFGQSGLEDSTDSQILKRGRRRAENALRDAREKLAAFDLDALSAAHLRCSRVVLGELDALRQERDELQDIALDLFEVRVSPLGLTRFYIASRLFGSSEVFFKYCARPEILGPSRRLGFDEQGVAADYSDEGPPELWIYLRPIREQRKDVARLTKECRAELVRAKRVLAEPSAA